MIRYPERDTWTDSMGGVWRHDPEGNPAYPWLLVHPAADGGVL